MRLFYLTVAVANDWSIRQVSGQKMPKSRCFTPKFEDLVASISGHFTDQQAAMRMSGKVLTSVEERTGRGGVGRS